MNNILIDELPTSVTVCGVEYRINTGFRICILFEQLMFDPALSERERFLSALALFYTDALPEDLLQAFEQIVSFYCMGRPPAESQEKTPAHTKKSFDYDQDAAYIYAAFLHDYRIDLQDEDLHWWKFKALLDTLGPDNMFSKIVSWRTTDTRKLKGEQKKHIEALQRMYVIKQPQQNREALDEIAHRLMTTGVL